MQIINNLKIEQLSTLKLPVINLFVLQCLSIFVLLMSNSIASQANESGMEEWHYTLRPGDNLQDISILLLNHKYSWNDIVKHNHINQPSNLAPGSIVKIPMHWLKHQPKPAKVKSLMGSVQIKKASSSRYETLKQDMLIKVGDEIATRNGNVVIEFADTSTIRLEEHSNLVFNKLSHFGKTGMVDTRLRLKKGSLSTDIPPLVKGSRYEIKTPSAVAAVRGTEFRLHSTNKQTRLEVLEGTVEFSGEHGNVMVDAGKGATIKDGNPRIEVVELPSPPKTQLAQDTIKEFPATINWDESQQAAAYKIKLTEKNNDGNLILKNKQKETNLQLDQIKNGDYELAIRSVNAAGYEGNDSINTLSVDIDAVKIQLLAPVDGAVTKEPKPSFSWTYLTETTAPVLSRLDIAIDKDFTALITKNNFLETNETTLKEPLIPGKYFWRIASLTNTTELSFSETNSFYLKGLLPPVQILSVNYIDKQVGLFWSPIPNTNGYILQVSDRIDFSTIMKEEKIEKPRAHLLLNEGKRYYARVKGIGDELYTSEFGPIQEILIEDQ